MCTAMIALKRHDTIRKRRNMERTWCGHDVNAMSWMRFTIVIVIWTFSIASFFLFLPCYVAVVAPCCSLLAMDWDSILSYFLPAKNENCRVLVGGHLELVNRLKVQFAWYGMVLGTVSFVTCSLKRFLKFEKDGSAMFSVSPPNGVINPVLSYPLQVGGNPKKPSTLKTLKNKIKDESESKSKATNKSKKADRPGRIITHVDKTRQGNDTSG